MRFLVARLPRQNICSESREIGVDFGVNNRRRGPQAHVGITPEGGHRSALQGSRGQAVRFDVMEEVGRWPINRSARQLDYDASNSLEAVTIWISIGKINYDAL